jgi:dUTP pyrophosphatase
MSTIYIEQGGYAHAQLTESGDVLLSMGNYPATLMMTLPASNAAVLADTIRSLVASSQQTNAMQIKVKPLYPDAILPRHATPGAACFDLHALLNIERDDLLPGDSMVISTGLAFEVPAGHVMLVYSRSGHGFKHGVRLANGTGVIDSDYRGEVKVCLTNDGTTPLEITNGDRIAQAMVIPVPAVELVQADELTDTQRGAGGFGSTGA